MKKAGRAVLLFVTVLVAAGCAGTQSSPPGAHRGQTVAVACNLGSARLVDLRHTYINTHIAPLSLGDWDADLALCTALAGALRDQGLNVVDPRRSYDAGLALFGPFRDHYYPNVGAVRSLAAAVGADLVLTAGPLHDGDPLAGGPIAVPGYGIHQQVLVALRRNVHYARLWLVLLDGASGNKLAESKVTVSSERPDAATVARETKALNEANATTARTALTALFAEGARKGADKLRW